jgi:hypothetical protein
MHDSTAIIFTQTPKFSNAIHVIDYHEESGEGLPHYRRVLASKPYVYGEHIGPHDLEVRELGTGKSRLEMAHDLGIRFRVARKLPLDDGINAVRTMLPLMKFDSTKCARLIDAMMSYHKKWNPRLSEWSPKPEHDWSSHACDAMRTGAVGRRNARIPDRKRRYETKNWGGKKSKSWMAA